MHELEGNSFWSKYYVFKRIDINKPYFVKEFKDLKLNSGIIINITMAKKENKKL